MDFVIEILKEQQKSIERNIKSSDLMQADITEASSQLYKVSRLKKAIKILKASSKYKERR